LLELARRGFHATGVDATAGLLETPRRMAEDEGLGVELVHADMREFVRARSFDAALSMATSFGYFPDPGDDRLVLANVLASLRAGGALLMELQGKEVVARSPRRREWLEEAGTVLLTEQLIRDDWTWVDNRLIFLAGERRQEFTLSHRLYSAAELRALLVDVGFGSVAVFGDLSGSPYGEAATALVVVARA
jgi:SAM-dependent methyltransferase